jgi:hypothetical protein
LNNWIASLTSPRNVTEFQEPSRAADNEVPRVLAEPTEPEDSVLAATAQLIVIKKHHLISPLVCHNHLTMKRAEHQHVG